MDSVISRAQGMLECGSEVIKGEAPEDRVVDVPTSGGKKHPEGPTELRRAKRLFSERRFEQALQRFDEAVRAHRSNPLVLLEAADAYAARYRPDKARSLLKQLADRHPDVADLHFLIGQAYRRTRDFRSAESSFWRAVRLAGEAPRARLELAYLFERTHRIDEGLEQIRRVTQQWPDSLSAVIVHARLLRRQQSLDEAESLLNKALGKSSRVKPEITAEAWGELAAIQDQAGKFGDAWASIGECKAIQSPLCVGRAGRRSARGSPVPAIGLRLHGRNVGTMEAGGRFVRRHGNLGWR